MSVVCAYLLQSVETFADDGCLTAPVRAHCTLHSGERCWVTYDSLIRHRADLVATACPPLGTAPTTSVADGTGSVPVVVLTVVDVVHPYPAHLETLVQRLAHIEGMLRRTVEPTMATPSTWRWEERCETQGDDHPPVDLDELLRDVLANDDDAMGVELERWCA